MKTKKKVTIEVFVPLGSCVCDFAPHMEKVGHVTSRFKDCVEVQMKSIKSPKASRYGVQDKCVVSGKIRIMVWSRQELIAFHIRRLLRARILLLRRRRLIAWENLFARMENGARLSNWNARSASANSF